MQEFIKEIDNLEKLVKRAEEVLLNEEFVEIARE